MDFRQLAEKIAQARGQVGQYATDALIGGPQGTGRPIPFPFNQGYIAKFGEAQKYPKGSPEWKQAQMDLATIPVMGLTAGVQSARPGVPAVPSIHPEDQGVMEKVIDYVRLKKPYNFNTELSGSDILEHYNLKPTGARPKTMGQVANIFDMALSRIRQQK